MLATADCAATLGSRFNLTFDPQSRKVYQNSFGESPGRPLQFTAAVKLPDDSEICLPFKDTGCIFEKLDYNSSITGFVYRGLQPDLGLELTLSVRAPFYPRDVKLSPAPFHLLKATVRQIKKGRRSADANVVEQGLITIGLDAEGLECSELEDGFEYRLNPAAGWPEEDRPDDAESQKGIFRLHGLGDFEVVGNSKLSVPFDFTKSEKTSLKVLWTGWNKQSPLEIHGSPSSFKYGQYFDSETDMAVWARKHRRGIVDKCLFLDELFQNWSLGVATTHFSTMALHSFLANSWWTVQKDGSDWFSVWEEPCYYHSGINVEYNCALFYLNFWPELLDKLLCQWAELEVPVTEKSDRCRGKTSFLCRYMGQKHQVGMQNGIKQMEAESNAEYILLMAARTFFIGDTRLARQHLPLLRRLAEYILDSDTNGNGFPDINPEGAGGDSETSPHTCCGPQTSLAVKTQAAMWALGELEELIAGKGGKKGNSERWKAFAAKSVKTLGRSAWQKDHYSANLAPANEELQGPETGEKQPAQKENGAAGQGYYSITTSNGLLYIFIANIKMARWNHMRMACDIETAEKATKTTYGNTNTSCDCSCVQFSQNLWRDYVAAYYGVDFLYKIEEYRDYQQLPDTKSGPALYRDDTGGMHARFHPRGMTVFWAPMAAAGLRINRAQGELCIAPLRRTLRVPVPALANWESMRVPWIMADTREGLTSIRITERHLLGGLKIQVTGAELEEV